MCTCVYMCVYFFSEGEGNVFCWNMHSTLFDKVCGKSCITAHDSHLHSIKLTALSSHMTCGGWSVLQSHSPFICVFDVAFILSRSNFFSDFFFSCVTSAPIPFFHRCAPVNISCYAKFAEALITFVSDNSVLHRLISGVMASKEIILGLCLLSLGNCFSHY